MNRIRVSRNDLRSQGGLAAVELALALPLLVMVMLAVAELGRAFYQYNALQKTTRDGLAFLASSARNNAGVIPNPLPASLVETTENLIVYGLPVQAEGAEPLLPEFDPEEDVELLSPDADHVQANVSYTYIPALLSIIPTFGFGDGIQVPIDLEVTLTMRAL